MGGQQGLKNQLQHKKQINVYNEILTYKNIELIKNYKTWDNYSISVLYLRILFVVFKDKFPNHKFIVRFSELLTLNIHPNPSKRKSFTETLKIFHKRKR